MKYTLTIECDKEKCLHCKFLKHRYDWCKLFSDVVVRKDGAWIRCKACKEVFVTKEESLDF